MKLTARGRYSIKALLGLVMAGSQEPISVRVLAEQQQIPAPFLEKLLLELRQAGLVQSRRGAQGGYQLTRSPRQIHLAEILQAVGEDLDPDPMNFPILSNTDAGDHQPLAEDWVTQAVWRRMIQKVEQVLTETTLEDLYYDARSWQAAQSDETGFIV